MKIGIKGKREQPAESRAERRRQKQSEWEKRERYTPSILRRHRKLTRREWTVLLIPAVAAVAAVMIVLFVFSRSANYQLAQSGTQYYGGSAAKVIEGAELSLKKDGTPILKQDGRISETTLPIYLDNTRKVVLPGDMLYYSPRSGLYERLAGLSEVECKVNGTVTVIRAGKSTQPEQGFLYDGADFYLFLEPMVVQFNGYTVELPALSYIEAVYGGHMMVFNYDTREFMLELCDGTGTAQPPSGDYVISLLGDSLTMYDGRKSLLATRPELFEPVV